MKTKSGHSKKVKKKISPSDLLIYHNDMHKIDYSSLSILENNLLFSLFKKLSHKDEIVLNIMELNQMVYVDDKTSPSSQTQKILEAIYQKVYLSKTNIFNMKMKYYESKGKKILESIMISLKDESKYLLQQIQTQFISFSLFHFRSLKSKYSKTLFRYISQFGKRGIWKVAYEEFKTMLGIPQDYEFKVINSRIIKPSFEELSAYINDLHVKQEKNVIDGKLSHKYLVFTFKPFDNNQEYKSRKWLLSDNDKARIKLINSIVSTLTIDKIKKEAIGQDVREINIAIKVLKNKVRELLCKNTK